MVLIRIAIRKQNRSHLPTIRGSSTNETERGDLRMKPLQVHISQFTQHETSAYGKDQGEPSLDKAESVERVSHYAQSG
jgi:hypothetical protein